MCLLLLGCSHSEVFNDYLEEREKKRKRRIVASTSRDFCISTPIPKLGKKKWQYLWFAIANWIRQLVTQSNGPNHLWSWKHPQKVLRAMAHISFTKQKVPWICTPNKCMNIIKTACCHQENVVFPHASQGRLIHDVATASLGLRTLPALEPADTLAFWIGNFITDVFPHVRFSCRSANLTTPRGNTFPDWALIRN